MYFLKWYTMHGMTCRMRRRKSYTDQYKTCLVIHNSCLGSPADWFGGISFFFGEQFTPREGTAPPLMRLSFSVTLDYAVGHLVMILLVALTKASHGEECSRCSVQIVCDTEISDLPRLIRIQTMFFLLAGASTVQCRLRCRLQVIFSVTLKNRPPQLRAGQEPNPPLMDISIKNNWKNIWWVLWKLLYLYVK